jgi:hypothetical protein
VHNATMTRALILMVATVGAALGAMSPAAWAMTMRPPASTAAVGVFHRDLSSKLTMPTSTGIDGPPAARPARVELSVDGSELLAGNTGRHPTQNTPGNPFGRLRWTTWGSSGGEARGAVWIDNCSPSCGGGVYHAYKASVRVYDPNRSGVFQRMTVRASGPVAGTFDAQHSSGGWNWGFPPERSAATHLQASVSAGAGERAAQGTGAAAHEIQRDRRSVLPAAVWGPGSSKGALVASVRPKSISFTPTAGGPIFGGQPTSAGIHWRSWTSEAAIGSTVIQIDTGKPDLESGYRPAKAATLTLSDPKLIEGRRVFMRMALSHIQVLHRIRRANVPLDYQVRPSGYWGEGYGWAS